MRKDKFTAYMQTRRHAYRKELEARLQSTCASCGTTEGPFDFDHVDPSSKTVSVADLVATLTRGAVLETELAKCQLLCKKCHKRKSRTDGSFTKNHARGVQYPQAKLTDAKVRLIRKELAEGLSFRAVGRLFGIDHSTIRRIYLGLAWKHVQ